MLGRKFDEALQLASELHRGQTRKQTPIPYIAHLMAVAGIVLEAHAYHQFEDIEDLANAALLHDPIEDQGDKIDLAAIKGRFGQNVHDIVLIICEHAQLLRRHAHATRQRSSSGVAFRDKGPQIPQ